MSAETQKIARANIEKLLSERDRMVKALEAMDQIRTVFESDANFILVEMDNAGDFIAFAKSRNVILRDFSKGEFTLGCIRISIGTPEQNDIVLDLLEEFKNQKAA